MVLRTSRSRSSVRSVCVNIFWDTPPIARRSSPCRLIPFDNSYKISSPHLVQVALEEVDHWQVARRLAATLRWSNSSSLSSISPSYFVTHRS